MEFVNTNNAVLKYGLLVVEQAKKNLMNPIRKGRRNVTSPTNDTGTLSNSLAVKQTPTGITITMIGYGEQVEEGRRPGKGVPPAELLGWVNRKVKPDEDPKTVSFLINRSIKLFGIEPTHFLEDAFEAVEFEDTDDAVFQDYINELTKKL